MGPVQVLVPEVTVLNRHNKKFNNARSSLGRVNARRLTWR